MVDNLVKKQVIQPLRKFIEKFISTEKDSSMVTVTSSGDILQVKKEDSLILASISEGTLAQNVRSWDYKVTFKSFPTKLSLTELLLQGEYEKAMKLLKTDRSIVESVLFEACFANNSLLCGILLDKTKLHDFTADVNAKNPYGKTVLHIAASEGFLELCHTILNINQDVEVNVKDNDGKTPLHLASINNELRTVELLLRKGAESNIQDVYGNSPLHYAFAAKHDSVIDLLKQSGASSELKNNEGSIPEQLRVNYYNNSGISDEGYTVQSPNIMKFSSMIEEINNLFLAPYSGLGLAPSDFTPLKFLGKGSFGEVYLVKKKDSGQKYAMKILAKNKMIAEQLIRYAVTERNIISAINSPFIVSLYYSFQTQTKLYLILDYCPGGTLKQIINARGCLSEDLARQYLSEIVLALEELHRNQVIYRDLKPENVVIDSEGHIKLIDFGLSKTQVDENSAYSFCGSISYLAPEVLRRTGHSRTVDWYLLGIIFHEMLTGKVPFFSMNNEKMFKKILECDLKVPSKLSEASQSLLKQLITKFPEDRLGNVNGAEDVKSHSFFQGVHWEDVLDKKLLMPRPEISQDEEESIDGDVILDKSSELLPNIQGWTFVHSEE